MVGLPIRAAVLVFAATLLPPALLRAAAPDAVVFPVIARVAAPQTYLRAGPGDDFYPTERLAAGAVLEVWAVDDSGYCAVRPVQGSFSWLRAADVELGTPAAEGRAGVVVTDGAVARVGSQINDLRHVTQVALEAGERVRVIETVEVASGRQAGSWVRIEPPAGEFRFARGVDLDLPPALAALFAPEAPPPTAGLAAAGEAVAAIRDASVAVAQAVQPQPAPAAPGPHDIVPRRLDSDPSATRLFAGWLPLGTGVFDLTTAPAAPGAVPSPPRAVSAGTGAVANDELADIDLALSLAVTGPSQSWNLAPLRERLRLAATRATTDGERLRAQAIDARLARFESLQGRQQALASAPVQAAPVRLGGMWSSLAALGTRPVRPGVLPGGAPAAGQPTWTPPDQAEATGRLATVVSRRPDAPRWAVVDAQNNVLAFITPQTGLDLSPLVGQQVAVRGAKGYMPEYKRPYIVASDARMRLAAVPSASPSALDRTQ